MSKRFAFVSATALALACGCDSQDQPPAAPTTSTEARTEAPSSQSAGSHSAAPSSSASAAPTTLSAAAARERAGDLVVKAEAFAKLSASAECSELVANEQNREKHGLQGFPPEAYAAAESDTALRERLRAAMQIVMTRGMVCAKSDAATQ